jgi:hypothetical protein
MYIGPHSIYTVKRKYPKAIIAPESIKNEIVTDISKHVAF